MSGVATQNANAGRTDGAGEDDDPFEACAHCGTAFETGVRYPVVTRRDADGDLRVFSFCDADCERAWRDEG